MTTIVLPGARRVSANFVKPTRRGLEEELRVVRRAWMGGGEACRRAGWAHAHDGLAVTLLDRAPYIARAWDDDRLWINVPALAKHPHPPGVMVHEFGHRIWFLCLNDRQRAAWGASWRACRARAGCKLVSTYAGRDSIEDFAEVFKQVVLGRPLNAENRRRWEDLRRSR